jgi:Domain of unknown function (DUF3291)
MPDLPWKSFAPVEQAREYVALLSYLPLKKFSKLPAFTRYTLQIMRQMRETPGVIGYGLRAKLFSREFWTLSVWEDTRSLMTFVAKIPHGDVMRALAGHMGATKFSQWELLGSGVPPSWDEAMQRMAEEK